MPKLDIPEDTESANSLSLSSNENGSVSNQSMASSVSFGPNLNTPPPPFGNEQHNRQIYSPIIQNFICSEPTLDAVLVICDK